MKIHTVDKTQIESGKYIGDVDLSDWQGHVVIEANLGTVKFISLGASGYIHAKSGSGINAGYGIEAGWGVEAGLGIEAGWGIEAGLGIEAGRSIEAGLGIAAGLGIEAGRSIEAGEGILCRLGLKCSQTLSFNHGLYVGACTWRETEQEERQAICGKLDADPSLVKLGEVIETGLTEPTIEIDGVQYSAEQVRERIAELKPIQNK